MFKRMNNVIVVCRSDGSTIGKVSPESRSVNVDLKGLKITV